MLSNRADYPDEVQMLFANGRKPSLRIKISGLILSLLHVPRPLRKCAIEQTRTLARSGIIPANVAVVSVMPHTSFFIAVACVTPPSMLCSRAQSANILFLLLLSRLLHRRIKLPDYNFQFFYRTRFAREAFLTF